MVITLCSTVHMLYVVHFSDIQPLKIFHFGGDEIPHGAWEGSPICEDYLGHPVSPEDATALKQEFVVGDMNARDQI